ncbi:MAG: OmpA family protein [Novosphingobium sp.]|nr:OmpA family protein [Novosphingobium sp.]
MQIGRALTLTAGACVTALLALAAAQITGGAIAAQLEKQAQQAIGEAGARGVKADFHTSGGWPTRHPVLSGGRKLNETARANAAQAVATVPGVGGVHWADATGFGTTAAPPPKPLHCQHDVEALLRARTIRFEEASARIDPADRELVNEVADALRPCLGSVIAITGHTDNIGNEPGNLALSRERAEAVERALIRRGIPADGLRASGVGSSQPAPGLDPADPANRRIEFSVIETVPLKPTPVDRPGPR